MSMKKRLQTLERACKEITAQNVTVTFLPSSHKATKKCSLETAIELARRGELEEIRFPLTYEEQQVKKSESYGLLDAAFKCLCGIYSDTSMPGDTLVLCSLPVVFARQAEPHNINGRLHGGYFITDDGEEFHQNQRNELLKRRNAGSVVVLGYDETKEPFTNYLK